MIHLKRIVFVFLFLLMISTPNVFAQSFPPRYAGELNVCDKISADQKEGKSLELALVNFFLSYSDQPIQVYRSIQRAIIYTAIQKCHFNGTDVIRAALRIDIFLPLLVFSMSEAGVNLQTLHDALRQAGLDRSAIDDAFEAAGVIGHPPSPGYARALPPPFEISGGGGDSGSVSGGGLGPASPFIP